MRRARPWVNELPTPFLIFKFTRSKVHSVFLLTNSYGCIIITMTNTRNSRCDPQHSYPGLALATSCLFLAIQMSAQQHLNMCVCVWHETQRERQREIEVGISKKEAQRRAPSSRVCGSYCLGETKKKKLLSQVGDSDLSGKMPWWAF